MSAHRVCNFHVIRRCVSSIFTCFSLVSFFVTSLHLSFGCSFFRCPPIHLYIPCAIALITTSSSVFLSTWSNHRSLASLIFPLMFATPALALISSFMIFSILFIPIIHLNILISVRSSKFCSSFLSGTSTVVLVRTPRLTDRTGSITLLSIIIIIIIIMAEMAVV